MILTGNPFWKLFDQADPCALLKIHGFVTLCICKAESLYWDLGFILNLGYIFQIELFH